ncbi:MAG: glutathione S-transferase family protein [Deltaproteobacteria bacterium]|nr:glutathione S-transferase family protein [Deltaproteobacteria bacterium]
MPTVLGINASPFVRKVRVALAEKGVQYDLDPVIPVKVSDDFKKISPMGKVPAYRDGDKTLCDSSVICAYIEKVYPNPALYPSDPYDYARALWFEEYGDAALVQVFGPKIFFQRVIGPAFFQQKTDEAVVDKAINEEMPPLLTYLESQIGGDFIVGKQFSIGDIGLGSQFVNLQHAGVQVDAARWPKLAKYVAGILARPSFKALIDEESPQFAGLR